MNEFPQFTTEIDGQRIHFLHVAAMEEPEILVADIREFFEDLR